MQDRRSRHLKLPGLGVLQTGPFFHKHPATNPNINPFEYNLEKAAELLREAGWKDSNGDGILDKEIDGKTIQFQFKMLAYNMEQTHFTLSIYAEILRKIGIVLVPHFLSWTEMQIQMDEGKFDAFTGGWGLSWQINPNQIWHSNQADVAKGSNRVHFKNDDADRMIEELLIEFDPKKRIQLAREFHAIVHEEQPYTFFYAPQNIMAWRKGLKNVIINQTRPQALPFPWYLDDSIGNEGPIRK